MWPDGPLCAEYSSQFVFRKPTNPLLILLGLDPYPYAYICVHVCMHINTYVYIYIYIYMHTCMHMQMHTGAYSTQSERIQRTEQAQSERIERIEIAIERIA